MQRLETHPFPGLQETNGSDGQRRVQWRKS
jgi:hypothetical protein